MQFVLVDAILEQTEERIVVRKLLSRAEEYLADHFPGFPILPGVMMVETMVQAARRLLAARHGRPLVLGEVRALRFGAMVRPGDALEVEVTLERELPEGAFACRGSGRVVHGGAAAADTRTGAGTGEALAANGKFVMRPVRLGMSGPA